MIYYITGGERSGKSNYAQNLALQLSDSPYYLATSRVWDDDHQKRIDQHIADRDQRWVSIEEEKELSKVVKNNSVVVVDCVTLWLTNFFVDTKNDIEASLSQAKIEFDKLLQIDATIIIISNEIGMGGHATTEVGRKFTELQGWMNQHIAKHAHKAILMVSGIPVEIKNSN
ncbi:bifunctional adenosylcobinamide kinase/adenosylcobinamide-phosphate guanylyltransferase [Aquimarina sp. 2201CG5-10]|uniref:bifunctional adenosylcobinamide kinase/adenosylcobinamide-phosphate guanylyltransferase n=1 Tax=Aquimarina callyspongiae TaxID=3098150 RepID=UPI002AB37AEF|nr:bifunctional adenosylcobinamide kinase/adenosylcobinamide-phosphate guanylyltransferase [Aquimarina sp. 2201CG5-10]MDY8138892.1 bifunctional adenosylcobinamide kinase/adenosylcobinamide-phosphate guanylyltransferase [Aquimarina sp. 2201CG5-10]